MKKLIKYLIIIISLIIISILFIIIYPVNKNNKYEDKLKKDIIENTNIKKIKYLNKDNNYYIIKASKKVIVYNLNYEEVFSIKIEDLFDSDKELVYRKNNLYYEEKTKDKDQIVYNFYNASDNTLAYTKKVGGS